MVLPVDKGELASGLYGDGRMAEPEAIINWLQHYFSIRKELAGKKVLITAGPTYEPIDPVRFIGNHSTGKMGIALAEACRDRGAAVTLIMGPSQQPMPANMEIVKVETAGEMHEAAISRFPATDIAVLCAAVADYRVANPAAEKIKKASANITLELERTPDILRSLGGLKKAHQIVIGFALETNNEKENAISKLRSKNADFIVLNSLNDKGAGFGHDTNKITIFDKAGMQYDFDIRSKKDIASDIINTIIKHSND